MSSYTNLSSWEWKPSSCLLLLWDVSLITAVWQTGAVCMSQWSCFSSQVTEECDHTERHSGSITTLLIRSLMQGGSVENRVTYQIDTPMNGRDIPSACVCAPLPHWQINIFLIWIKWPAETSGIWIKPESTVKPSMDTDRWSDIYSLCEMKPTSTGWPLLCLLENVLPSCKVAIWVVDMKYFYVLQYDVLNSLIHAKTIFIIPL